MTKKFLTLFVCLCMVFTLLPQAALAAPAPETVEINEVNFPDPVFRDYISKKIDTREPVGVLTPEEYMTVTSIDVDRDPYRTRMGPPVPYVHDLTGIEYFSNLAVLIFSNNPISQVNLSRNSKLRELNCDYCELRKLDLSGCPELEHLHCESNMLETLNLSGCAKMTELFCDGNRLRSLDVSSCPNLEKLICRSNRLHTLNVSQNPALDWLFCSYNQLQSLDLSGCPNLTDIECGRNFLQKLDLSHAPKLDRLQCQTNSFTELDVSSCPALELLACGDSRLEQLNADGCRRLTWLYCANNALSALDLHTCTGLSVLDCANNRLETLDLSHCSGLWNLDCSGNRLSCLDLSGTPGLEYPLTDRNIRGLTETDGAYLLSQLQGFDPARASLITGGSFKDGKAVFDEYFDEITYRYDTGNPNVEDPTFILSRGHVHTMEYCPEIPASCTEDGVPEHWHCAGCGKNFADPYGDTELTDPVIPATGHSFGDWIVTLEPTTEAEGSRTRVCSVCGFRQTESIPALAEPTEPPISTELPFTDVKKDDYFYPGVAWAVSRGITGGTSPTTFSPDRACTRAEAVTFLWSMAGRPEPEAAVHSFRDVPHSIYYEKAVLWAVENGITAGAGNGKFAPNALCSRSQIVTFLWNMEGRPEPETAVNSFSDVRPGAFYERPVLWAVENGITAGAGNGKFAPDAVCTRAQIVTFLWRDAGSPIA